ncbi:MAG: c-type cytochrome [Bryobacteraceae bacterium]
MVVSLLWLLALSGFPLHLYGQQERSKAPRSAADIQAGSRIFRSHCAECHGLKGEGGRGPDLTRGDFRHGSSDQALFRTISLGVQGTQMPGIYFDEKQVWQIVAFVRSLNAGPRAEALRGDAARGAELFRGKGGCSECHMVAGEGGRLGPDLTYVGSMRTPRHLHESLTDPGKEVLYEYWIVRFMDKSGNRNSGIRLNEDAYSIQLLDMKEQLHSISKQDLREWKVLKESLMPGYAGALSGSERDDLVAYLSTLRRKPRMK